MNFDHGLYVTYKSRTVKYILQRFSASVSAASVIRPSAAMDLGDYLSAQMARPWAWGFADCTTFAADWVRGLTGIDPMRKWRGYKTEADVELLIAEAGGLLALWGEGMMGIWPRINREAISGDIALITVIGEDREAIDIGAIFTGKRWAFRSPRGIGAVSIGPGNLVATWGR